MHTNAGSVSPFHKFNEPIILILGSLNYKQAAEKDVSSTESETQKVS